MSRIFSVSTLIVLTSATAIAYASDGTVNFTGELAVATCKVSTFSGQAIRSSIPVVELPTVSVGSLSVVGATSSHTPFRIVVTCSEPRPGAVLTYFESGPGVDSVTKNVLNVGGTAKGVQF